MWHKASRFVVLIIAVWFLFIYLTRNQCEIIKQAYMDVPDIIRSYGYAVEEHTVVTGDGYHVTLHRIPRGKSAVNVKGPVLLQHSFIQSSADFVIMGPENSLAFLLADSGYDVWLGNHRGNYYSRKHSTLSPDDPEFWDFTIDELANDTGDIIDYILENTNTTQLPYIGYSLGGSVGMGLVSDKPEYNNKLKLIIFMAPPSHGSRTLSFTIRQSFLQAGYFKKVLDYLGIHEYYRRRLIYADLARIFCSTGETMFFFCKLFLKLLTGSEENNINKTIIPVIFGHSPAGTSRKVFEHLGQLLLLETPRYFDYGVKNIEYYGMDSAPDYEVEAVNCTVYMFCGTEDKIVPCETVERLWMGLTNARQKRLFLLEDISHLDFIYGIHVKKQLYNEILEILDDSLGHNTYKRTPVT